MRHSFAAASLALLSFGTSACAADLLGGGGMAPISDSPTLAQPVEIGSGWYIRGDVGMTSDHLPSVTFSSGLAAQTVGTQGSTIPPAGNATNPASGIFGSNQSSANWVFDAAAGYRVNNYLRLEAEYAYWAGQNTNQSGGRVVCPYQLQGLTSQGANPLEVGYLYDVNDTCDGYLKIRQTNNLVLANAYIDIGTFYGLTPYVGGGLGMNVSREKGGLTYTKTSDGSAYAADLTPTAAFPNIWTDAYGNAINPTPQIAFAKQNWNRTISSTRVNAAWALSFGVGYQLTPAATLDVSYRYLNMGTNSYVMNPQTNAVVKQTNTSQQVRVGIRYMAD